jgi:hypothetical protein
VRPSRSQMLRPALLSPTSKIHHRSATLSLVIPSEAEGPAVRLSRSQMLRPALLSPTSKIHHRSATLSLVIPSEAEGPAVRLSRSQMLRPALLLPTSKFVIKRHPPLVIPRACDFIDLSREVLDFKTKTSS